MSIEDPTTTSNSNPNGSNGLTNGHSNIASHSETQDPFPLPIVIAGGGCVGLFLALLLTTSNPPIPNPILIIEPHAPDPTSTRAMAHQPPTYPILSRVPGLLPELIAAGHLSTGLRFRTSIANGSKVIASKSFDNSGEGMKGKGQLLLPQGKFQEILLRRLRALPRDKVDIRLGCSVTNFTPHDNSVTVHITNTNNHNDQGTTTATSSTIQATYLIDATGAHSPLRPKISPTFPGITLPTHLIATDMHFDFHAHNFHDANFVIDPNHYGLIGLIHPATPATPALWRCSFGVPVLPPSISSAQLEDLVHEKLTRMLPNAGLNQDGNKIYTLARIAPYKPHQRLATTLSSPSHRTLLIGDAAHLTNPYAGLGLASGIADASSLADVLVRIGTGQARDAVALSGAWSEARREVFVRVVDGPSRAAYERVRRDVGSEEKVWEMVEGDKVVGALKRGVPILPPSLETRGEELEGW